jgi:hypothetical protein
MPGFWPDYSVARSAFVEEETCVDGHRHLFGESAEWTRQQRQKQGSCQLSAPGWANLDWLLKEKLLETVRKQSSLVASVRRFLPGSNMEGNSAHEIKTSSAPGLSHEPHPSSRARN